MRYRYLLVDLDDTLLDYRLAERLSLREAFAAIGIGIDAHICQRYSQINRELWSLKEKGVITRPQLRHERFARLLPEMGLPVALADDLNTHYSARLRVHGETIPGAEELLKAVHGHMKIAAVTNGVTAIQRSRLERTPLPAYLDEIIISEEVSLKKPDPAMLHHALRALGCTQRRDAIMLGDSLSADIAAANAAGIDSIWLSAAAERAREATFTVHSLEEAKALLLA